MFVIAAGDTEDIALELIADGVAWNLGAHPTIHEDTEFAIIFDIHQLLRAIGGVGDVQLHGGGYGWKKDESVVELIDSVLRDHSFRDVNGPLAKRAM